MGHSLGAAEQGTEPGPVPCASHFLSQQAQPRVLARDRNWSTGCASEQRFSSHTDWNLSPSLAQWTESPSPFPVASY